MHIKWLHLLNLQFKWYEKSGKKSKKINGFFQADAPVFSTQAAKGNSRCIK